MTQITSRAKPLPNDPKHVSADKLSTAGGNMMRAFGHPFVTWCDMSGAVCLVQRFVTVSSQICITRVCSKDVVIEHATLFSFLPFVGYAL